MKVHLKSLGCRLNQGEIDRMARQLAHQGHQILPSGEAADLVVINTCAVTQEATRSSRQLIYQMHRANPEAEIAVTGCYAHIAPGETARLAGVTHVIDNFAKESLVSTVTGQPVAEPERFDLEPVARDQLVGALGRTRAFIKIQDGCDRKCSFCVTRLARGTGRSRPIGEIVTEVHAMLELGYQEAVLTGVQLGSYGDDLGLEGGLYELLRAILADTDMPRIRLSSLEPWGISQNFFSLWENPRLGKHLHLPLQSGCDATLRRMIRRTSQREFRAIVQEARASIPDLSITTDVIVGFPGETDAEFAASRDFIREMDFAGTHIFRYSKRAGTAAARLPGQVSEAIKKQRSDDLHTMSHRAEESFARRFIGSTRRVLWEAVGGATDEGFINSGYTDNYLRVRYVTPEVLTDKVTSTRLTGYLTNLQVLQGEISA